MKYSLIAFRIHLSQLSQFYGPYSNSKLLLEYGFILDNNPYNSLTIEPEYLGVDPEDEIAAVKEEHLQPYTHGDK